MPAWTPDPWLQGQPLDVLLPTVLFGEGRGETLEGQMAIGSVIRQRVLLTADFRKKPPDDDLWRAIILKPWAFSCFDATGGNWNHKKVVDFARQVAGGTEHSALTRQLLWVADGCRRNAYKDVTSGATHYFVRGSAEPHWAQGRRPVAFIDSHDFYKLPERDFR